MSARYSVGIMGAGRIAQGLDQPGDPFVLTLAHAVSASDDFSLGGFFDIDSRRVKAAEQKWGCQASPQNRAEWLNQQWDVVCIATPDNQHAADLRDVLRKKPKAVMVEKPVATDSTVADDLLHEAYRLGIPVFVNYPRRWHSGILKVAEIIRTDAFGRPVTATFVYSSGLSHNGVHMLDFFHGQWGGEWNVKFVSRQDNVTCLSFEHGNDTVEAVFIEAPLKGCYVWEMQIYCTGGKVELSNSPEVLTVWVPQSHPVYRSYRVLRPSCSFQMEEEPLLCRAFKKLADLIGDPVEARLHSRREIETQAFIGKVLRVFQ